MKSFPKIILIVVSISIILSCAYFKSLKEGLTSNNTIILIGDSILNNSNYVPEGKSVVSLLESKSKNVVVVIIIIYSLSWIKPLLQ